MRRVILFTGILTLSVFYSKAQHFNNRYENSSLAFNIDQIDNSGYWLCVGGQDTSNNFTIEILKINSGQPISTTYSENYDEIAIKDKNNNLLGIGRVINGYIYPKRLINFNK